MVRPATVREQDGKKTMTTVLDYYAVQNRATLQCFKNGGADGIAHYLTASMSDPREINRQELEDSHAVDLAVHLVYEMNPTYAGYFTFAQGAEDCRQAQARLVDLGAPEGTVVYFTVDVNIDPNLTVEYFNGVASAVTPKIIAGCYGFQRMCEFAFQRFPNVGKHLWQTYGTRTVPLELWQHLQETRCGVEVDVNDCTVDGWKRSDMATAQEMWDNGLAAIVQEKVVAPLTDTDNAIKALVYAYESADQAAIAEAKTKVAQALERAALLLDADAAKP
jgi:hypothetical protein